MVIKLSSMLSKKTFALPKKRLGYQILLRELKDLPGTLSTRARLRKPTPTVHLCNRLLHDYRGGTSSGLWRTSRTLRAANGTRGSRLNTVRAATS
jgi:hypothetical protein